MGRVRNKRRGAYLVRHLIDCVGTQISKNDERRVIEAFTTSFPLDKPIPWIKAVRHATDQEERQGIDIVFETTDAGIINLQVKGSDFGLNAFTKKQARGEVGFDIIGLVINPGMDNLKIFYRVLSQVSQEYRARKNAERRKIEEQLYPQTSPGEPGEPNVPSNTETAAV